MSDLPVLDAAHWNDLETVQRDYNNSADHKCCFIFYSEPDLWELVATGQDHGDIALAKRKALLAKGWPDHALRLAVCFDAKNKPHVVLTVDVIDPEINEPRPYVLSNTLLNVALMEDLRRANYDFISRQLPGLLEWSAVIN